MAIREKEREFKLTVDDFNFLRKMSNEYSGIQVSDERFDMFYSRLSKRVRKLGLGNFKEYCQYLIDHPDDEFTGFINAITTNLTAFFRESHHFEYLRDVVIPEVLLRNKNSRQIRGSAGVLSSLLHVFCGHIICKTSLDERASKQGVAGRKIKRGETNQ